MRWIEVIWILSLLYFLFALCLVLIISSSINSKISFHIKECFRFLTGFAKFILSSLEKFWALIIDKWNNLCLNSQVGPFCYLLFSREHCFCLLSSTHLCHHCVRCLELWGIKRILKPFTPITFQSSSTKIIFSLLLSSCLPLSQPIFHLILHGRTICIT